MKKQNEKEKTAVLENLLDLGAVLVCRRLLSGRLRSLERRLSRLDQQADIFEAQDISFEIAQINRVSELLTELISQNAKQITNGHQQNQPEPNPAE